MERIRLLAVIDHLGGGGAEKQFMELVTRLEGEEFEVRVHLAEGGGMNIPHVQEKGIALSSWGEQRLEPSHSGRNTLKSVKALARTMREFRPHVTLGWLSYSITLTAIASLLADAGNLIFSERSSLEYMFTREVRMGSLKRLVLRAALGRARFVVTNTASVANEFIKESYCSADILKVIHNGIDLKRYSSLPSKQELREKLGMSEETVFGVYVGKYEERKGLRYLEEALRAMGSTAPEILAIGSGSMEDELRNNSLMNVLGYRPDAIEFIRAADFLVLPSLYEGLPNVVLEAMAVGTPVVATAVQGTPELISDGVSGLLVPPMDSAALKDALALIAKDFGLRERFMEKSFERVLDFSMEQMVSRFAELMRKAAGKGNSSR